MQTHTRAYPFFLSNPAEGHSEFAGYFGNTVHEAKILAA